MVSQTSFFFPVFWKLFLKKGAKHILYKIILWKLVSHWIFWNLKKEKTLLPNRPLIFTTKKNEKEIKGEVDTDDDIILGIIVLLMSV